MVIDKGVFEIAHCGKDDSENPDCGTKMFRCAGCLSNGTMVTTNRLDKPLVNRYRKVPVEIEAAGPITKENIAEIAKWCRQDYSYAIFIKTLEGTMKAEMGDYIIKGVEGEFYPCKPKIFEKTYEEV